MKRVKPRNSRQQGLVMIAMLLLVFMAGTSLFFISFSDRGGDIKNIVNYNQEMVQAKQALITFATNYPDLFPASGRGPGRLPCPDLNLDGGPDANCDDASEWLSRLPVYTATNSGNFYLSHQYTEDNGSNEYSQLWYSISPYFATSANTVNSSISGSLSLNGESDYVAIILAPGEALTFQSRTSLSEKNNRNNYLESPNSNSFDYITYSSNQDSFNDKAIGITQAELMTAVTMRVVTEIKKELDYDYENGPGTFPSNGNFMNNEDVIASWYADDDWKHQVTYNRVSADEATIQFNDCDIVYTLRYDAEPEISRSTHSC